MIIFRCFFFFISLCSAIAYAYPCVVSDSSAKYSIRFSLNMIDVANSAQYYANETIYQAKETDSNSIMFESNYAALDPALLKQLTQGPDHNTQIFLKQCDIIAIPSDIYTNKTITGGVALYQVDNKGCLVYLPPSSLPPPPQNPGQTVLKLGRRSSNVVNFCAKYDSNQYISAVVNIAYDPKEIPVTKAPITQIPVTATFLSKVPKDKGSQRAGGESYNCAYYKFEFDPASFDSYNLMDPKDPSYPKNPFDQRKRNGIFFKIQEDQNSIVCDDPDYILKSSLNRVLSKVNTHYFYPVNGVYKDSVSGKIIPLKQSVILELPYNSTDKKSISVSLYQNVSGLEYSQVPAVPNDLETVAQTSNIALPTEDSETKIQPPPSPPSPPSSPTTGVCQLNSTDVGYIMSVIDKDTNGNNIYFTNGSYAIPYLVTLTKQVQGTTVNIDTDVNKDPCAILYNQIGFFKKNTESGTNELYLVTNDIFSDNDPVAVLPQDASEMNQFIVTNPSLSDYAKYTKGINQSDQGKIFYFYVRVGDVDTATSKAQFYPVILNDGIDFPSQAPDGSPSFSHVSTPSEITLSPNRSPTSNRTDAADFLKSGRTFSLSPAIPTTNPTSQRLDYLVGVSNEDDTIVLPGVFYSMVGGTLSNCTPATSFDGSSSYFYNADTGEDFSIICNNNPIGYMGYSSTASRGAIDTTSQFLDSTINFHINDGMEIIPAGEKFPDGTPVREPNHLVLFDAYGGPHAWNGVGTTRIRPEDEDYGGDGFHNFVYFSNEKNKAVILYQPDCCGGINNWSIGDTSLGYNDGNVNNKGPNYSNPYTYVSPGAMIMIAAERKESCFIDCHATPHYYAISGADPYNTSRKFIFQVSNQATMSGNIPTYVIQHWNSFDPYDDLYVAACTKDATNNAKSCYDNDPGPGIVNVIQQVVLFNGFERPDVLPESKDGTFPKYLHILDGNYDLIHIRTCFNGSSDPTCQPLK